MSENTLTESAGNSVLGPPGVVTSEVASEVVYLQVPGGRIAYEVMG
jgi:hypothetical protein